MKKQPSTDPKKEWVAKYQGEVDQAERHDATLGHLLEDLSPAQLEKFKAAIVYAQHRCRVFSRSVRSKFL